MDLKKYLFISFIVMMAVVFMVYLPSLSGGFLYDDFWSLEKLSEINGVISWENLSAYLISSDTGPLKRPVSMLSFLIDAQDWPADPYSFRVTNLIIHIFNGLLLFTLLFGVLKIKENISVVWIALFATLLWMLHPFLVSTVAYMVQRMAMLPVFFALLSMLLYLKVRLRYQEFSLLKSSFYLSFILYGLSFLAALSKENGLLILLYIPLFEYFICQKYLNLSLMKKYSRLLFTILPVVLLILALAIKFPDFYHGYKIRDFTLYERLISEARALTKYLFHWAIPSVMTEGVYTDTFKASTSLLNPISTIFSLLFIGVLITLAIKLRNKWPLFSFAVLFYFVSHLIESTFIPLQLYFEHRNYAAYLFLALPLVLAVFKGIKNTQLAWVILMLISLFLASQTFFRSALWGDPIRLKTESLEAYPKSIRARIGVVEMLENKKNYYKGLLLLEQGIDIHKSPALIAYKLKIKCHFDDISQAETQQLVDALTNNGFRVQDVLPIGRLIQSLLNDECDLVDDKLKHVEQILTAVSAQLKPDSTLGLPMYYYARGRLAHNQQDYQTSTDLFIKSFQQDKNYQRAIMAAAQLLNSGQPELALKLLEVAALTYDNSYITNTRIENEIVRFINLSQEDIAAKNEDINHNPGQE